MDNEKKLIKRSIGGDVASFEQLIKSYQKMAYNVAYRMMGNEEDAKDMTQEAFIKVFKSLKRFRMDASFSTWLYRIVMNTCKDEMRKKKLKVLSIDKPLETEEGNLHMDLEDEGPGPEDIVVSRETQEEVHEALQQVSEKNRVVVILRDIKGFSYAEISEIIDVPVGTIKSRISRGRQELKSVLLQMRNDRIRVVQ